VQPIVDRIVDQLLGWKAALMTRAARKVQVQYVLTGLLIYLAMAVNIKAIKAIDKIRRGFLWRGRKEVREGHYLVAWGRVCTPLQLGGLAISSLKELSWALRMRWLWLQKTEPSRPWCSLPIQVPDKARASYSMVLTSKVGNGANTLFWTDKWIHGQKIADLVPRLFDVIPKRITNRRTVQEALT
jgi:hypothetical protein